MDWKQLSAVLGALVTLAAVAQWLLLPRLKAVVRDALQSEIAAISQAKSAVEHLTMALQDSSREQDMLTRELAGLTKELTGVRADLRDLGEQLMGLRERVARLEAVVRPMHGSEA